jgi:hypothetical protein
VCVATGNASHDNQSGRGSRRQGHCQEGPTNDRFFDFNQIPKSNFCEINIANEKKILRGNKLNLEHFLSLKLPPILRF